MNTNLVDMCSIQLNKTFLFDLLENYNQNINFLFQQKECVGKLNFIILICLLIDYNYQADIIYFKLALLVTFCLNVLILLY